MKRWPHALLVLCLVAPGVTACKSESQGQGLAVTGRGGDNGFYEPGPDEVAVEAVDPELLQEAYGRGYDAACAEIFDSPNSARYFQGDQFTADDCLSLGSSTPDVTAFVTEDEAEQQGHDDAVEQTFLELAPTLCYGEDCVTEEDF